MPVLPESVPASHTGFDDVLRQGVDETNRRLLKISDGIGNVGIGVQKIRANSLYNDKKVILAAKLNKLMRHPNG